MTGYSYRQPIVGQTFIENVEGRHSRRLTVDAFAGKYLLLGCIGSGRIAPGLAALEALNAHASLFDDIDRCFLGVALDPNEKIPVKSQKGIKFIYDEDGSFSRHCGAQPVGDVPLGAQYRVTWTILDPGLRVVAHVHTGADRSECELVFALLRRLPETDGVGSIETPAPVLVLPRIFEPAFCDRLVALYDQGQSRDSGFMRDNVEVFDYALKRRRDYFIDDEAVRQAILKRISQCVVPDIRRLFFMKITRMERYLIGCYSAEEEAHFRPHRDNGQTVTAHRRFALSVALNDDFKGGDLVFPEYNQRKHRIPKGWCIAFPCAILHAVTRVTRGRRYVFLPFLYDEVGAAMKAAREAQTRQPAQ